MSNRVNSPATEIAEIPTIQDIENLSLDSLIGNQDFTLEIIEPPEALLGDLSDFAKQSPKEDVEKWRLLHIHGKGEYLENLHSLDDFLLIGYVGGAPYITSAVTQIDPGRNLVKTQNSLYALRGEPGAGEPSLQMLLHISYAINTWGMGLLLRPKLDVFY